MNVLIIGRLKKNTNAKIWKADKNALGINFQVSLFKNLWTLTKMRRIIFNLRDFKNNFKLKSLFDCVNFAPNHFCLLN